MFTRPLAADELIPPLNKPPANPPPSASLVAKNEVQRNLNLHGNRQPIRRNFGQRCHQQEIPFTAYEHFIISKEPLRQLCCQDQDCDIYVVFCEDFSKLPPLGISSLSALDLWKDEAQFPGCTAITSLQFVRPIPYKHTVHDIPQPDYDQIKPRANQAVAISLRHCVDGLKMCFTFFRQPPTNWFFVQYPPFVNDFSLVIEIEKTLFEKGALKMFSTSGYLNWQWRQFSQEPSSSQPTTMAPSVFVSNANALWEDSRLGEVEECRYCMEPGRFVLLYPCGHYNMHERCILLNQHVNLKELEGEYPCATCSVIVTKFMNLRFPRPKCYFCPPDANCATFNSYFYPCGCSLGCLEGFKQNAKRMKLALNCPNCNTVAENLHPFYR